MKKYFIWFTTLILCLLSSCKNSGEKLMPSISGKAGEVLVVIEKAEWEEVLGESLRNTLEADYPYLPLREPLYTLIHVTHGNFTEMFKVHRNIIFTEINPQIQKPGVTIVKDKWASPQIIINIAAYTQEDAKALFEKDKKLIINAIEQAERDRVVRNAIRYENREIRAKLEPVFGGGIHAPSGYELRKLNHNFAWMEYNTRNYTQGIFVYSYPVEGNDLLEENIIRKRNQILKANVPGPDENTYMQTAEYWKPTTEYVKYRGMSFAQTHGQWDVAGAFMGGPFVSHAFYSKDGTEVIVLEAWVFAPKDNKRNLFRQTESILYSWEWKKESEKHE